MRKGRGEIVCETLKRPLMGQYTPDGRAPRVSYQASSIGGSKGNRDAGAVRWRFSSHKGWTDTTSTWLVVGEDKD